MIRFANDDKMIKFVDDKENLETNNIKVYKNIKHEIDGKLVFIIIVLTGFKKFETIENKKRTKRLIENLNCIK